MVFLLSQLPRTVLRTSSDYNDDIRVVREWGGMKLLVNGSRQSGQHIRNLWLRAFHAFRLETFREITSILVLGIGGGTVIELLAVRYPQAKITAVDIDQTIIDIAKRYFHMDQISKLQILRNDANTFVKGRKHYDLIVIDLFIGRKIPAFVGQKTFFQRLKRILAPGGRLVLNYLREREYQKKSDGLFLKLDAMFPDVRDYPIANNRFFCAALDKRNNTI